MNKESLLTYLKNSARIRLLGEQMQGPDKLFQLKGLNGSADAAIAAGVASIIPDSNHLFILSDREEASYFQNDLSDILDKEALFFPISYKRPYQYEEVDNANILQRTEVLNSINELKGKGCLIVTYPEALVEKVVNKRSLVKNSFGLKVGEQVDLNFITELLVEYGFEKVDFVYEAGNFAIRGGIVDIFSYAHDHPLRIELFANKVESIRSFNPDNQLSLHSIDQISIIPDLQTKLLKEERESFFTFIPENTYIWQKDHTHTVASIEKAYSKIETDFEQIKAHSGEPDLITTASELFIEANQYKAAIENFKILEFGKRFAFKNSHTIDFNTKSQPSFNKDFKMLTEDLSQLQSKGFQTVIVCDSLHQMNRVRMIIEEHDPSLQFDELPITLRAGYLDLEERIAFYTDHELFERFHKFRSKERYSRSKAITINELKTLKPGDFVTHIDHGVGRFAGLEKKEVDGVIQERIRLVYRDDDLLYINVHSLHKIAKHSGQDGTTPVISKLGSAEWENKKKKVKKKVKEIAINLIGLYAKRVNSSGFGFSKDSYLQTELETSFIYEDTPDQAKATNDVKSDMEAPHPMDRLVCGDVGFGKTEVAIRAAFKAVCDGKQVAVLVPTTILALQHYKTFKDRLRRLPCRVDYVNRFRSTKEIKEIVKDTNEGKIDILVGTHRIVGKDISFKDLGLLIIDEEQKFGVVAKDKLKELKVNVDVLTLTATPIPRTLQFSLMGARDLSVIATPPTNRQPVSTELHTFDEVMIRDAIRYELKRGGQVFFVHNRIKDIDAIGNIILKLIPDARVGVAHGQMDGKILERTMLKFINQEFDILISTNIIESGLDIPNANTIIINHAHMYGLSDLHQMRGRVGRSNKKAFCYLLTPSSMVLSSDARKRLSALEEFSDLGDGIKIAMRDLDIRGAGNLLGGEQSGFISDIGFETYQQLLDEAIQELKETAFKELFNPENSLPTLKRDCIIETDLEVIIPDDYVNNISERLRLYNVLDNTKTKEELDDFVKSIIDRFGPLPPSVNELTKTVILRWRAEDLGFFKLKIKNETMKCFVQVKNNDAYFQSAVFGAILEYIQEHPKKCNCKEVKNQMVLTFSGIENVEKGISTLETVLKKLK